MCAVPPPVKWNGSKSWSRSQNQVKTWVKISQTLVVSARRESPLRDARGATGRATDIFLALEGEEEARAVASELRYLEYDSA